MKWRILFIALILLIGVSNADTLVIYASEDGHMEEGTDAAYSTMRAAAGDTVDRTSTVAYIRLTASSTTDVYNYMDRAGLVFNTSEIPDTATIDSVTLSLYAVAKTNGLGSPDFGITAFAPANEASIAAGDYDSFGGTELATAISYAGITAATYNIWTFNADGKAAISKTGNTKIMVRDSWDIANSFGGSWSSAANTQLRIATVEDASGEKDPYITINYTASGGDTTPPASITGVTNQSLTCNSADWSWTNPGDSDYGGLKYWINNTLQTNLSNTTVKLNLTGLPGNTAITFSSKTFDLTGNLNATFVNDTITTPACPDTTPPASITGLTNTSVSCNQLFFNWTNPGDSDYGGLMLWRNNTALTNLSNATTGVSWDGLPGSTAITFSSKTFDLAGNVNASFVNMTRNTDACGVAPVADFSANDTTVCTTDPILFTDLSTNTPTSWSWSFGDGNSSAEQNPVHTYNITGLFTVGLVATNAFGEDEEEKVGYINVTECAAPTPTPTPTPAPTPANTCIFANMTGVVLLENSTNLSIVSGETSWGLTILNATEGNVSYFQCGSIVSPGGSGGGEAIGIVFGILGGMVGGIVIMRRGGSV